MRASGPTGLERMRAATDPLHLEVENRTGLPESLSSVADLIGLLHRWADLAHALEPRAGVHLPGSIVPLIAADLHALGADPAAAVDDDSLTTGDEIGTAWVLLGARLGLTSLAPAVGRLAGRDLATFRSLDAATLIALRHRIDELDGPALDDAIGQATTAFAVAGDTLQGPPWS